MENNKKIKWGTEIFKSFKLVMSVAVKVLVVLFNIILTLLLILAIMGVICGCAFAVYINSNVDTEIDETMFRFTEVVSGSASELYRYEWTDRTNRVGEAVPLDGEKIYGSSKSVLVDYNDLPENLINAFIAVEDKRFREHSGVDWIRTSGAFLNFFVGDNDAYGGSTITQQLIKNVTGDDDYKIQRKIQEIFWALDLEKKMDKTSIITSYMNIVGLANGYTGVGAAAQGYFSKDVSELSLIECAAIASITKNPSKYDPIARPEDNKTRRETVLWLMLEQGLITQAEYDEVSGQELVLNLPEEVENKEAGVNSWYVDMVINDVIDDLVEIGYTSEAANMLVYSGGLKIYTLIDPEVQKIVEEIYLDDSNFKYTGNADIPPQCSAIIIHPYTGDILGVAGARGEKRANRVQSFATDAIRPVGSSIKPLAVYAPAMEYGVVDWNTPIDDSPFTFNGSTPWPQNVDRKYLGLTTLAYSIEHSLNTASIKTLNALTVEASFDFLDNELNFFSLIDKKVLADGTTITDKGLAALGLGQFNYGITLRELAGGYTMFPNNGVFSEPRSYLQVCDREGNVILDTEADTNMRKVVLGEENAFMMTEMLKEVVTTSRFKEFRKMGIDFAGKTGTTGHSNVRYDYTFVGYTPYYLAGIWYGFEYPKSLPGGDSDAAALVWVEIMCKLHEKIKANADAGGEPLKKFNDKPSTVVEANYCVDSGKLCTAACHMDPRGSREVTGYFEKGTIPTEYCDRHVVIKYAADGSGVAHNNTTNYTTISLVHYERNLDRNVKVADAGYLWRELPIGIDPYTGTKQPFYYNLKSKGIYTGYSGSVHYNRLSTVGFDLGSWREWVAANADKNTPGE